MDNVIHVVKWYLKMSKTNKKTRGKTKRYSIDYDNIRNKTTDNADSAKSREGK